MDMGMEAGWKNHLLECIWLNKVSLLLSRAHNTLVVFPYHLSPISERSHFLEIHSEIMNLR